MRHWSERVRRGMLVAGIVLVGSMASVAHVHAQTGGVRGVVTADEGGPGLSGVNVWLVGTNFGALTDAQGRFSITGVTPGPWVLKANRIGFANAAQEIEVEPGETLTVDLILSTRAIALDAISVSGSRRIQKVTDAPVSLALLTAQELGRVAGGDYVESYQRFRGVDTYRTGVAHVIPNARGFTAAYNSRFRVLVDNLSAHYPALGAPATGAFPVSTEDIERIEVVLGPSSALYGPDAHSGLMHIITKNPREYPGASIVAGFGTNASRLGRVRYAGASTRFAYKLNAEYNAANDWVKNDTVAFDDAGRVYTESEEPFTESMRGTASLYYFPTAEVQVVATGGYGRSSGLLPTSLGRNRNQGLVQDFQQLRVESPRFYFQGSRSGMDLGDTHSIENKVSAQIAAANSGSPITEDQAIAQIRFFDTSIRWTVEGQFNERVQLGSRAFDVIAGVQHEDVRPNSNGTVFAEGRIALGDPVTGADPVKQTGVYAQIEADLSENLRIVAAGRYDTHSRFDGQASPRVALVYRVPGSGSFRVTYNRAFQSPTLVQMESLLRLGTVPNTSIPVVLRGNGTGFKMSDGRVIERLSPERNTTWEIGYKGQLNSSLFLDVNAYRSNYENFQSPATAITDPANGVFPVEQGDDVIPGFPAEYVLTYFDFGRVRLYGMDVGLTYRLDAGVDVWLNYSTSSLSGLDDPVNDFNGDGEVRELTFNAPENKASFGVGMDNFLTPGLYAALAGRWVQEFEFRSGLHHATVDGQGSGSFQFRDRGPLGGFTTFDVNLSYTLNDRTRINLSASNVMDEGHREMIGSPEIRRLIRTEIKHTIR